MFWALGLKRFRVASAFLWLISLFTVLGLLWMRRLGLQSLEFKAKFLGSYIRIITFRVVI